MHHRSSGPRAVASSTAAGATAPPHPASHRDVLAAQALYSIPALARVAGVTRYKLRRVLLAAGVRLIRAGRALYVPISEIEAKIPPLWQSIRGAERARRNTTDTE